MLKKLLMLLTLLTLAGCKDTGGGVVGYVNSTLDRSTLSTAALSISMNEGGSHSLLVVLDHGVTRATSLDWSIAAPNGQFATKSGSVSMSEGQSSALITLDSLDNNVTDGHRSFTLTISGSSFVFANSIDLQVTIIDNESAPLLTVADISVAEGNGAGTTPAVFTVTASNPSATDIIVNYTTVDVTAASGNDYNAASGTLTIPAGSLTGTITVPVIQDTVYETNTTFNLVLSGGTGYTVAGSRLTAVGTIEDDESQSTISIADISVTEGTGGGTTNAVFTITMASLSAQNVTVNYATSDGTALAGADYTSTTGTATITAGSTTTTVTIPVNQDSLHELDKTFTVRLSGGSGYLTSGSTLTATGTIVDDDAGPTLSIANNSVTEGNSGVVQMTFTVTASTISGAPITFNYASSNGSATAGTDYTAASGTATIAAGSTSTTFNISIAGNTKYQTNRTFTLTLSGGVGYTAAGSTLTATGTITDDDIAPTISISNITVSEGTGAGTTNAVFTVTSSALSDIPITFDYATSDGSAVAGSDYINTSGSATILAGSTTAVVTVPVTRDALYEGSESFNITLSNGSGYLAAGSLLNAIATITDDDQPPTISIGNVTVTEGTGAGTTSATFTVTLSTASALSLSVNYATSNGTAGSSDFTSTSGTLNIAAGSTTGTFTVPVAQDSLHENDETFTVTLSGGSGYKTSGSTLSATGTIEDDDDAPTISIANASLAEGNSGTSNMTFTVTASAVSAVPITFNYATSNGTALAGTNYTASSGSKTIAAGATTTTFTVPIIGNTMYESNKAFTITLTGGSGYVAAGSTLSATGTITNDDTAPTISIANISVVEGTGAGTTNAVFTVTTSSISDIPITFDFATSDGTAIAGTDYTDTTGSGTILAGSSTASITVPVTRDSLYEANKSFNITLSNGSGYQVAGSLLNAIATITDDDVAPTISIGNVTVTEGTGAGTTSATFTVTLATVSGQNLSVNYATSTGTAGSSDFTATSGTLNISAGATTGTITVPVAQDSLHEADETFTVTLSGGSGYKTSGSTLSATGTIEDDDDAPTISIANVSMAEGNAGTATMTFTVTSSATSGLPLSFNYATSNGTAIAGTDYTTASGSKTIAAGATSTTITVSILGNTTYENSKTLTVTLSAGSEYTSAGSTLSATGTITNDDAAPTVSIGNIGLVEGSGAGSTNVNFTVTASTISGVDITFDYATSDGTATAGSDYTATSGSATIPAGQTMVTIAVPVTRDTTYEPAETFTMTLSNVTAYTSTGSTLSATATVSNDDLNQKVWDFQTSTDYTFGSFINFSAGSVTLKQVDTTSDSASEFNAGTLIGATVSGSTLKLNTATANDMSYSSSWTPKYNFLVGYWKFDGNWNDSTANGNTMTHSASATTTSTVIKSGSGAGVFGSSDWGSATLPATYTTYTISAWFFPLSMNAGGGVVAQATTGTPAITMGAASNYYWSFGGITSSYRADSGAWAHLVAVQNGSTQSLYVNGTLVGTSNTSSSLSAIDLARVGGTATGGWLDEVAVFSAPLSAGDVSTIYNRQKSRYNGLYTSPVMDMGSGVDWDNLTPVTAQPFYKELPVTSEASQPGLMTDIAALYHFNESAFDTLPSSYDFYDSTGNGFNLEHTSTVTVGSAGVFHKSINFNGGYGTGPLSATVLPSNANGITLAMWVTPSDVTVDRRIITFPKTATSTTIGIAVGRTYQRFTGFYQDAAGSLHELVSTTQLRSGSTYHVALTIKDGSAILYVNGLAVASGTDANLAQNLSFSGTNPIHVGTGASVSGSLYGGLLDELGIWRRSLSAAEVLSLYRRGTDRVKYQVRSCVDAACNCASLAAGGTSADCDGDSIANANDISDANASAWIGPDGTATTYFSELQSYSSIDTTTLAPTGTVSTTDPVFDWTTGFYASAARPTNNRYFQYRIFMDTDDNSTLCSGAPCVPEITSVKSTPHGSYYGAASIENVTAISYSTFQTLIKSDVGACTTYQVSTDNGSTWKYYDTVGNAWTTTTAGVSKSNPTSDFTTARLNALPAGSFKFRAYLSTNAAHTQSCELNSVTATFLDP